MAQLRLLPCSPSPLSFSRNSPPLALLPNSTFPNRIPHFSLSSFPSAFPFRRRPKFPSPISAVAVSDEESAAAPAPLELSPTRLLAQNIHWSSTADDIRALFEKHGTVIDVEIPMHNKNKNRGLAFVEMGSEEEAIEALTKLEGYVFEDRSLKLNYAVYKKKPSAPAQPKQPVAFNLFVANLSFDATSEDLREFFGSHRFKVVSAGVVLQGNPKKSAGYGFVSFATKREADAALSYFQGKELMGREIQVERSNRFVKVFTEPKSKTKVAFGESEDNLEQNEESAQDS